MKRRLFKLAAAASLLLSLTAAAAWAMSYALPLEWHLLGTLHSSGLRRIDLGRRAAVSMMPADGAKVPPYGYWDGLWARSRSGRLSVVAQAADFGGNVRALYASPQSLMVDMSGPARTRVVASTRLPNSRSWARRLGFAWAADAQQSAEDGDGAGGVDSVEARIIMLPWWFIVLLGLPLPLLWLRADRRSRSRGEPDGARSAPST
jgi:hypothetical protein